MEDGVKNILLFGGTSEGRILAQHLSSFKANVFVSTATEYGMECIENIPHIQVFSGRMDRETIIEFIRSHEIHLVVDATHPFARVVTANIRAACEDCSAVYIRCLREKGDGVPESDKVILTDSVEEAVEYLKGRKGNILISTGSKDLKAYTELEDYKERCYARVLSTLQAVEESTALGFKGPHLIAMQGPFSEALNTAMLEYADATYFVTKESGKAGGFEEKFRAAVKTGAVLIVVGRPVETGKSLEEVKEYIQNILTMDCKRDSPFCKGD